MSHGPRHVACLLFCLTIAGCSHANPIAVLDNHGGYAHPGRRINLFADGSYTDTRYTDVENNEHSSGGTYNLTDLNKQLLLTTSSGTAEHLYRVDFEDQHYWVSEADKPRIPQPDELQLRHTSLRGDVK